MFADPVEQFFLKLAEKIEGVVKALDLSEILKFFLNHVALFGDTANKVSHDCESVDFVRRKFSHNYSRGGNILPKAMFFAFFEISCVNRVIRPDLFSKAVEQISMPIPFASYLRLREKHHSLSLKFLSLCPTDVKVAIFENSSLKFRIKLQIKPIFPFHFR